SWIRLPSATAEELTALREALRPARLQLTDAPAELRAELDPWDVAEGPELELMRRVKERFDPKRVLNPGIYVGGI
nr:FAD-binding oxidoreductase [Solirubrobacterales bacterium]